jgi:hypothetical protein
MRSRRVSTIEQKSASDTGAEKRPSLCVINHDSKALAFGAPLVVLRR